MCFETDWTPIRELLTKGGEKVTEADVVEVEGRAAFVRVYYTSEEATILYYLADPKAAGFHKDRGNAPSGPMSDEQKEERKALIANNKRGFATKREAEQYLASIEVAMMRGEWLDPTRSRATVSMLAGEWFAAQVQIKPTTRSGYRYALDKHILPKWGERRLNDVGHGEIQAWVNALTSTLGPSQVRQVYLVLAGVMRFAIRDGRLQKNPCDSIQLPRLVKKRRGYLTHAQVRLLAKECGDWSDVVYFLAYTGLRWGEMAGIRVGRVDLSRRRVDIAEAVSEPRGVIIWGTPKNHSRRSVPFPEFLEPMVKARSEGKGVEDVLFVGPDGGVLRAGNFRARVFKPAVDRAKTKDPTFPTISIHDLRHTAASLAVSAGANVKAVQRMLGHASAAMTLDVYADLFDDDLDAVATAMNRGAIE